MEARDELIERLRGAYGIERGLQVFLARQLDNAELHNTVRERFEQHLGENRRHGAIVTACLESIGTDISALQPISSTVLEALTGAAIALLHDQRIADPLAAVATEQYELSFYRAVKLTAEEANCLNIAEACDWILTDEERMLDWLGGNLPVIVQRHLCPETAAVPGLRRRMEEVQKSTAPHTRRA